MFGDAEPEKRIPAASVASAPAPVTATESRMNFSPYRLTTRAVSSAASKPTATTKNIRFHAKYSFGTEYPCAPMNRPTKSAPDIPRLMPLTLIFPTRMPNATVRLIRKR